jgi:geranylgeranyl pyrophosphate synthase
MDKDFEQFINIVKTKLTDEFNLWQQKHSSIPETLKLAISDNICSGGKMLRPSIIFACANSLGIFDEKLLLPICLSVEFIHSYSLIHDDLPCMDNSTLRRGKPSCWAKYGQDIALLVGDGLLTESFNIIADSCLPDRSKVLLVSHLSKASGMFGMVAGQFFDMNQDQFIDLNPEEQKNAILHDIYLKTGAIIEFCCFAPSLINDGLNVEKFNLLKAIGNKIGTIYQIVDDFLDQKSESQYIGKPTNQDANKLTLIKVIGFENTKFFLEQTVEECSRLIKNLNSETFYLEKILEFVKMRKN